jgi:hypothetical protein
MRFPLALLLTALLVLPLGACKKKPAPRPGPGAEGGPATAASAELPELIKKYKAMSAAERTEAAKSGCYVSSQCKALETKALFAAASGTEKASLKAAARPVFARQYEKELVDKGKKPDSVVASGDDGTTLEVKGPPCNRFLLSNFMNDFGDRARTLGFKRVACENKALKAKIDL